MLKKDAAKEVERTLAHLKNFSPSGLPRPKCPFFVTCKKQISVEHFRKYCAQTVSESCFFGFTQCPQYEKNKRKKPREWLAKRRRVK